MNRIKESKYSIKNSTKFSKMGYEFNLRDQCWQLDSSIRISFKSYLGFNEEFVYGLRMALSRYAEELSANMTKSVLDKVKLYLNFAKVDRVTLLGIRKWRESLDHQNEYKLGVLKAFLIAWHDWGYPGVCNDVVDYLETLTLRGNIKGRAVKSRCPYTGPLTAQEQNALISWSTEAFEKSEISLQQYSLFMVLLMTGRRLVQVRSLRAIDLQIEKNAGEQYYLQIPRAKQRGVGYRGSFKKIEIVKDLFLLLDAQIKSNQKKVKKHFKNKISKKLLKEVPIFIEKWKLEETTSAEEFKEKLISTPDYYHMSSRKASDDISSLSRKCQAYSERTGEYINFTARRFRYTKATNLSIKGISGVYLAEALDHSDTQQIGVYVENTPKTAEIIDDVMAPALAPLAQAFAGQLIDSEKDAIRANDPHSKIRNSKANELGNCGTHSFCANSYRSCYTCVNFQPWRDANHSEVRDEIIIERQRQKDAGVSTHVIQATDRLLLAVEQVILMCKQARGISNG